MKFSGWHVVVVLLALMVGCSGASGPELMDQGVAALKKEQYDEAIELLKKATDRLPRSAQAYNYLGAAYQGKGNQSEAVRAFEKSVSLDAKFAPARFNLGVIYFERQQHDRAIEHLARFIELQPANVEGYFHLASAQFQKEALRDAYGNYLKVVESDPNRPEVLNNLGVISAKLGQEREAETWFISCIKTDAKYSPAYLNLAILYHHTLGKSAAALDYYQQFLELEPAGPSSDRARQAIESLRKGPATVVRLEPRPEARPVETTTTSTVPPPSKTATETPAVTVTQAAPTPSTTTSTVPPTRVAVAGSAQIPGNRWATRPTRKPGTGKRAAALQQFNRGAQLQQQNKLDAAVFAYGEAIKLDASLAEAHYNLGTALQTQRNHNQAIESYLQALAIQPAFVNARLNLAILFEAQGYIADAAEQYEELIRHAPNHATAHLSLGRIFGKYPATAALSRQHYQRFLALAPDHPDARRVRQILESNSGTPARFKSRSSSSRTVTMPICGGRSSNPCAPTRSRSWAG